MRSILALLSVVLLTAPARATWSIVVANAATGEVCVASATCLPGLDLQRGLPVVVPGVGAGASQASLDSDGLRRKLMWQQLQAGLTPSEILVNLEALPNHQGRQYGLVALGEVPITFTGTGAGKAKFGVTGVVGELSYAIQGNVLTANSIITAAEQTLLTTPGDLSQRVMAAMETVRSLGGDGRCSCNVGAPASCGAPPVGFTHSAYTAFIVLARNGDPKGVCNPGKGCANGNYYLAINVIGNANLGDPVTTLGERYAKWRALQSGRPDGVLSLVDVGADSLPADGVARTQVCVRLVDLDGNWVTEGGAKVWVVNQSGVAEVTTAGPVTDHGDGSYSFELTAGTVPGEDSWRVLVDDGLGKVVRLYPEVLLRVDPVEGLHVGRDEVSAGVGGWVPLTVNFGGAGAGGEYRVLGSGTGTVPGVVFEGVAVPLNRGRFMRFTWTAAGSAGLVNTVGVLDLDGRAEAGFSAGPGQWGGLVGGRVEWAVVVRTGLGVRVSGAVGFDVVP